VTVAEFFAGRVADRVFVSVPVRVQCLLAVKDSAAGRH
jgi:hypothetical protein